MTDTNSVILIGRLTADSTLKYTNSGLAVSTFSIAMSRTEKYGDTWEDKSIFVNNLAIFGKRAEGLSQYLTKGQQVAITGYVDMDKWVDNDGSNKSRLKIGVSDIQLLGGKRDNSPDNTQPQPAQSNDLDDSDIPF